MFVWLRLFVRARARACYYEQIVLWANKEGLVAVKTEPLLFFIFVRFPLVPRCHRRKLNAAFVCGMCACLGKRVLMITIGGWN